jgi:hypothetical protein
MFYSVHSRVSGNPGAVISGSPLSRGRTGQVSPTTDSNLKQPSVIARIFLPAPGAPVFSFPSQTRDGAERRKAHPEMAVSAKHGACLALLREATRHARLSALHMRRFCASGPYFRGRTGAVGPLIPAAFAAVRPARVQPLKADPRSRVGMAVVRELRTLVCAARGVSRTRGYEPQRAGAASRCRVYPVSAQKTDVGLARYRPR